MTYPHIDVHPRVKVWRLQAKAFSIYRLDKLWEIDMPTRKQCLLYHLPKKYLWIERGFSDLACWHKVCDFGKIQNPRFHDYSL